MKKVLIAITAFLYLVAASGVVVNVHYCMGRIAAISYGNHSDSLCSHYSTDVENGDCGTEYKLVKLPDTYKHVKWNKRVHPAPAKNNAYHLSIHYTNPLTGGYAYLPHPPPVRAGNAIYLYNCVFRI